MMIHTMCGSDFNSFFKVINENDTTYLVVDDHTQ